MSRRTIFWSLIAKNYELVGNCASSLSLSMVMVLNRSQRRKSKIASAKRGFWIIFAGLMVLGVIVIAIYAFLVGGAQQP